MTDTDKVVRIKTEKLKQLQALAKVQKRSVAQTLDMILEDVLNPDQKEDK